MAFFAGLKCTLCLNKSVLAWRGRGEDKDGRLLANKVQVLQPNTLPSGIEA